MLCLNDVNMAEILLLKKRQDPGKFRKYWFYSEHKYSCIKRQYISDSDTEHG